MRIAPKAGYDFGNKRQYRRNVWKFFADNCPVPRAEAQCLLMPSLEGDEIEVALSKGFKEQNLHIVDMNPAIVATHKRTYPRINTYGVSVIRAAYRIPRRTIHLANIDLCSNLCLEWCESVHSIAYRLAPGGLVAATFLKGRDPGVTKLKDLGWDRDSIATVTLGIEHHFTDKSATMSGEYRSHNVPMRWVAGRSRYPVPQIKVSRPRMEEIIKCERIKDVAIFMMNGVTDETQRAELRQLVSDAHGLVDLLDEWTELYSDSLLATLEYENFIRDQNADGNFVHGWSKTAYGLMESAYDSLWEKVNDIIRDRAYFLKCVRAQELFPDPSSVYNWKSDVDDHHPA